jgi:Predicted membrane protein
LTPQFELTYNGSDSSIWSADAINSSRLNVGEKENITLTINVPEGSWAGSLANLKLMMSSNDFQIEDIVSLNLTIDQVAGWRIDLSNTNLEVPPEGGMINLTIEQKGNAIVRPYFYKSGDGWSVELPSSGPAIEPGQSATISVNITPPSDAVAGEVGVISIMIQNGVPLEKGGSGIIVENVPIRVGASPGIELGYKRSLEGSGWRTLVANCLD